MIDFLDLCRAAGYGFPITSNREVTMSEHVARGYFSLGDHEQVVHVNSSADFLLYIWARNTETAHRGVQVTTPASQFRGPGSSGENDGLVIDVPAQTGVDLGCIGGQANETIHLSSAGGPRVVVYLTVVTADGATVEMTRE